MEAIKQKIEILDSSNTVIASFENDAIESITEESQTNVVQDELFIDQTLPVVRYKMIVSGYYVPCDYDHFDTVNNQHLCFGNTDLRNLPAGTNIKMYGKSILSTEWQLYKTAYIESVERTGKEQYKLNCVSAIGLMDKVYHKGGVYIGVGFGEVLQEWRNAGFDIVGFNAEVNAIKVSGWLPYDTFRNNLHRLLLAFGLTLKKYSAGGYQVERYQVVMLKGDDYKYTIQNSNIFADGNVEYNTPPSRIEVTEHTYLIHPYATYEKIYDNNDGMVIKDTFIKFSKPYDVNSLRTTADLTIVEKGVNYAILRGRGTLEGKPYYHNSLITAKNNPNATVDKVISVNDNTVISMLNSQTVLDRLAAYYFDSHIVKQDIKIDASEIVYNFIQPGNIYTFNNAFDEQETGFLQSKSSTKTSFERASCEFVVGFVPPERGSDYTTVLEFDINKTSGLTPGTDANRWNWYIPDSVKRKKNPVIRVAVIEGGMPGNPGENGKDGANCSQVSGGKGGKGGKGGEGGDGGRINFTADIDVTHVTKVWMWFQSETSLIATIDYDNGKSEPIRDYEGKTSKLGYGCPISGKFYGMKGVKGCDGADGGDAIHFQSEWDFQNRLYGFPGNGLEAYEQGNVTETAIAGGLANEPTFTEPYDSAWMWSYYKTGGNGGGGAAIRCNQHWSYSDMNSKAYGGGRGGTAGQAQLPVQNYGNGGHGGHGGGGGGGGGVRFNNTTKSPTDYSWCSGNVGGDGGQGSSGYKAGILIYY